MYIRSCARLARASGLGLLVLKGAPPWGIGGVPPSVAGGAFPSCPGGASPWEYPMPALEPNGGP